MVKPGTGNREKSQIEDLRAACEAMQERNRELEETLDAIRSGEVDAIIVANGEGRKIYTLEGPDLPYRSLVENIQEGALTLSKEGTILYANRRFAGMVKLRTGKVTGTSLLDHICPEDRADIEKALRQTTKTACRARVRIRQGNNSLPVLISMNPLSSGKGARISVVVTDRKKDEDRLLLQARMLNAVGDAVIATEPDRKITYWNNAATKIYGWTADEVLGHNLNEVKTRTVSENEAEKIETKLAIGETWAGECTGHHRDGHSFPVYAHDAPVFDDDGKLIAIIGASHDITERKNTEQEQMQQHHDLNAAYAELRTTRDKLHHNVEELTSRERELVEALAEKEILLSEVHHRVKNNLTAFISLLSLEGSCEETETGRNLKKDLQNRARSMALIHETLYRTRNFSKVDMEVYLTTLIDQVAASYSGGRQIRTLVEAHDVVLDLSRATTAGLIINELVTNSFKYAFPPSFNCQKVRGAPCTIRVTLVSQERSYILSVADNGTGLPAGFEPLASKTLGLKLVNFLAHHQLRAEIGIVNDRGTEFVFRMDKHEEIP